MPKLSKKEFYEKYYPAVIKATEGTGLHPQAVIAQMAIESNWGNSGLTSKYNNFFGIKSHGEKGGVTMDTEEEREGVRKKESASFRTYDTPEDSIRGYVDFLQENPRYKDVFNSETPEAQAEALQKAGYATSSRYANDIKRTMSANSSILDTIPEHAEYISSKSYTGISPSGGDEPTAETEAFRIAEQERESKKWDDISANSKKVLEKAGITEKTTKKEADKIVKEKMVSGRPNWLDISDDEKTKINDWINAGMPPAEIPSVKGKTKTEVKDFGKSGKIKKKSDKPDTSAIDEELRGVSSTELDYKRGEGLGGTEGGISGGDININDLSDAEAKAVETGTIDDIDIDALKQQLADNKELMWGLENQEEYQHIPSEFDRDLGGTLMDAGRGIVGMLGATKELPVYERGEMFQTSMDELTQRRNMGLTPDEIGFAKQMAERGYGYDVKNIRRMAGGSAGVALGNLGRATGQLYDEYGELAVRDEGVRRMNRSDFNRGALSDEQVNRQIFEDELIQAERSKSSAAGLTADAIKNMRDRGQYNRAYGPESQFFKYQEDVLGDLGQSKVDMRNANAQRKLESTQQYKRENLDLEKRILEAEGGLTENLQLGGESPLIKQAGKVDNSSKIAELERLRRGNLIDEELYQSELLKYSD